jgi:predicted glycosyl hydrolase (DUF1957 family)
MLQWINFLHLYQPPGQHPGILTQVGNESYRYLVALFKKYPELRATVNLSGSLVEQWREGGFADLIEDFKNLATAGQVELVGSAMYHPILPLLPRSEIERQIILNNEELAKSFGAAYRPTGFYLPEMAYSQEVAQVVVAAGFKWIILDEIHFPENQKLDPACRYQVKGTKLGVVFRDRKFSKSFPPEAIAKNLTTLDGFLVTAHDGEMYGHRHRDEQNFIERLLTSLPGQTSGRVKILTVSDYLATLAESETVTPRAASWESVPLELRRGLPYALWLGERNQIQKELHGLQQLVIKIVAAHGADPHFGWARGHLDRGLASCYAWWAARAKPDAFSPVTWHPSEIERGALELVRAVRSLQNADPKTKVAVEKKFFKLVGRVWQSHWLETAKKK